MRTTNIFKALLPAIIAVASLSSCSGALDLDPTDRFSASTVWATESSVDSYVYGFYAIIRENVNIGQSEGTRFTDAFSDLIKSPSWNQYNHPFNVSLLQESSFSRGSAGTFECWSDCYERIRRQNEFLRDCDNFGAKFSEEFRTMRKAEVRFIRAFSYFRLMRVYGCEEEWAKQEFFVSDDFKGGVILRDEIGGLDGPDQNDKPRSSWDESWDFIIADLNYAAENLPTSWTSGRVTKAAAYAFLSRVALYAKRWDVAIEAANACADLGCSLTANYADIFSNASNKENLFVVSFSAGELTHRADVFFRPAGDNLYHTGASVYGAFSPTNELVDLYEMADGSDFSWSTHGQDPYTGREPRFYASILYNGAEWEGRTIQTYVGGEDGFQEFTTSGSATATVTGYYLRKWITENDKTWEKNGSSHFDILIRYAEVLLNKAEALAEQDFGANKTEALAALNAVRARAKLPAKDASSLEEFRTILRKERCVELAGEGLRYWDIRRWKIGEDVIAGKQAHGVRISYDSFEDILDEEGKVTGKRPVGEPKYERVQVDGLDSDKNPNVRIFYPRFYAFSLPTAEISNNTAIGDINNNPGW